MQRSIKHATSHLKGLPSDCKPRIVLYNGEWAFKMPQLPSRYHSELCVDAMYFCSALNKKQGRK